MRRIPPVAVLSVVLAASMWGATPEASPTIPAAAADQGKDTVHALNNAFTHVFETVAPSVVIIEVAKKNDGSENSAFDDLFFLVPLDENNLHRNFRGF